MSGVGEPEDYERRFRRAGLPLFIEDRSAREDVWTRAAPLLALVFLGEMLGAIQLDWPVLANVAAALGGLAILLGAFGLLNLARGRPFWSRPQDVGDAELAAFVLFPAALPLIFGGQAGSAPSPSPRTCCCSRSSTRSSPAACWRSCAGRRCAWSGSSRGS